MRTPTTQYYIIYIEPDEAYFYIKYSKPMRLFAGAAFQHLLCLQLDNVMDEHQRVPIRMAAVVVAVIRIHITAVLA